MHDFTLNITVPYKGGGGGHFSPFFALRNISMVPRQFTCMHVKILITLFKIIIWFIVV